jgi:hypothetical protein
MGSEGGNLGFKNAEFELRNAEVKIGKQSN